ncbi:hypothetical protein, partial [Robiginitalea sp.]|uniref:hypothetical protein n=1 Tax=Robiginitalea sp. TaxID=1902411 RepID=UPI003C7284B7
MRKLCLWLLLLGSMAFPMNLTGQLHAAWEGSLSDNIDESSGLLLLENRLVTLNDSGNAPVLYEMDTTSLEVVRKVTITNSENIDWEALSADATYIYIGDFGNNLGKRKDLRILRVPIAEYWTRDAIEAEVISFFYEDQVDFSGKGNSDWDAEALIAGPDSLWVFTKQWQKKGTTVYSLPKTPGKHKARKGTSFNVRGLVTDAALDPRGGSWYLLGYTGELQPFLLQVPSGSPADGFPVNTQRHPLTVGFMQEKAITVEPEEAVELGAEALTVNEAPIPIGFAQAEGMAVSPEGDLFISSEAFDRKIISLPSALYRIPSKALTPLP